MYGAVYHAWKKWAIGEPHSWEICHLEGNFASQNKEKHKNNEEFRYSSVEFNPYSLEINLFPRLALHLHCVEWQEFRVHMYLFSSVLWVW